MSIIHTWIYEFNSFPTKVGRYIWCSRASGKVTTVEWSKHKAKALYIKGEQDDEWRGRGQEDTDGASVDIERRTSCDRLHVHSQLSFSLKSISLIIQSPASMVQYYIISTGWHILTLINFLFSISKKQFIINCGVIFITHIYEKNVMSKRLCGVGLGRKERSNTKRDRRSRDRIVINFAINFAFISNFKLIRQKNNIIFLGERGELNWGCVAFRSLSHISHGGNEQGPRKMGGPCCHFATRHSQSSCNNLVFNLLEFFRRIYFSRQAIK